MSRKASPPNLSPEEATAANDGLIAPVVALNEDAALYMALAEQIRGTAVGLSPAAQNLLRDGLISRFGPLFSEYGPEAVDELLRLATDVDAA